MKSPFLLQMKSPQPSASPAGWRPLHPGASPAGWHLLIAFLLQLVPGSVDRPPLLAENLPTESFRDFLSRSWCLESE